MAKQLSYNAPQYTQTATITSGQSTSSSISLATNVESITGAYVPVLVGIFIPSSFTGTAITFNVSQSAGGTYVPLVDGAGNTITKMVAASQYLYIDPNVFAGVSTTSRSFLMPLKVVLGLLP